MPATSVLLLTAGSAGPDQLRSALIGEAAGLAGKVGVRSRVSVLWREADPPASGPTVPRAPADELTGALVLEGGSTTAAVDLSLATTGLAERLGAAIDPSRSAVLTGTDHMVMLGEGPAVRLYALRRLPHLSPAQFRAYWLDVHSHFGRRALAGAGYRQVHADADASRRAAVAAGLGISDLDGAVLSATSSWEAYGRRRSTPGAGAAGADALADEDNFIDHTRSMAMAYTRIEI